MSQLVYFTAILLLMLQFRLVSGQTTHTTTEGSVTSITTSWDWVAGSSTASTRFWADGMTGFLKNKLLQDRRDWAAPTASTSPSTTIFSSSTYSSTTPWPSTSMSSSSPYSSTTPDSTTTELPVVTRDKSNDWLADINSRMRGGMEEVIVDYDETTDPETEGTENEETVLADANNPAASGNILEQMPFPDSGTVFLKPMSLFNIVLYLLLLPVIL